MTGRLVAMIILLTTITAIKAAQIGEPKIVATQIDVCFTPAQQCEPKIVAAIKAATVQVLVQGYGFTDPAILSALADAQSRHVEVMILLDKSNVLASTGAKRMRAAGIPVWIDRPVAIAHNKVMIIDGVLVLTGSYNWTLAAQRRNAENILFIHDQAIAALYSANWKSRWKVSTVYTLRPGLFDKPQGERNQQ